MLAGDPRAFEEFFDGCFPGLYRFASSRLDHDEDAAEEAAQAAICKAIAKLHTYRGEAALFTWLCTFCRHEIAELYRRIRVAARHVSLVDDVPEVRAVVESLRAELERADAAFDRQELARLVQVALDLLPERYGSVLEWKYIDELPVAEIAARLALSPKAAESLLTRAREAFRECFKTLRDAASRQPRSSESSS
jgi:RNA polymerase sigma-70 factor (ECF subfamily)